MRITLHEARWWNGMEAAAGDSDDNNEDEDSTLTLRSKSKDIFRRRTSTGSEVFFS